MSLDIAISLLDAGLKRYVYDRLQGKALHVFEAHSCGQITVDQAVTLLMHSRSPWWVRMWWIH